MGTVGGGVTKPPGPVGKLSISVFMGIVLRSMSDPCLRESEEAQRHGGHRTKQNENNKGSGFWIPPGEAYCEDSSILAIQQRQALLAHLHGPNLQQGAREGACLSQPRSSADSFWALTQNRPLPTLSFSPPPGQSPSPSQHL